VTGLVGGLTGGIKGATSGATGAAGANGAGQSGLGLPNLLGLAR